MSPGPVTCTSTDVDLHALRLRRLLPIMASGSPSAIEICHAHTCGGSSREPGTCSDEAYGLGLAQGCCAVWPAYFAGQGTGASNRTRPAEIADHDERIRHSGNGGRVGVLMAERPLLLHFSSA